MHEFQVEPLVWEMWGYHQHQIAVSKMLVSL